MKLADNARLLMIGDSVTAADRSGAAGVATSADIGHGYVGLVRDLIADRFPDAGIWVGNAGIPGNTVKDLQVRWSSDVLSQAPDWLSIMIGINDVWRQFDSPDHPEWHVPIDLYEAILERLIGEVLPQLAGLVLMTPYLVEPDRTDPMRRMMDRYGEVVIRLAQIHGAVLVDTQAAFDASALPAAALAPDRIHPTPAGHNLLARAFLAALDFPL